jgi:hypothetical protein
MNLSRLTSKLGPVGKKLTGFLGKSDGKTERPKRPRKAHRPESDRRQPPAV